MSWKTVFYGLERPSKQRIIIFNFIFAFFVLWGYGWWVDFVPSSEWSKLGNNISIALAAILTLIYYWALATRRTHFKAGTSILRKILALLLLPGMLFALFWISITHGIADIATRTLGNDKSLTIELSKNLHHSRKSCDFRLTGHAIERAMPNYICITESQYKLLPAVGIYTLQIQKTTLGFHIISLNTVQAR